MTNPNNQQRISKIMKAIFIFLFVSFFTVSAHTYSQGKLNLNVKNTRIEEVFFEVEKKSGYKFLFSGNVEREMGKKISLEIMSATLTEIVDRIVANTNLHYNIVDKQIIVSLPKGGVAQTIQQDTPITINGKIVDSKGEPLAGANICVKNTEHGIKGVVADQDGCFTIKARSNEILVVSYIGFKSKEITVTKSTHLDILLEEDQATLQDVVITGFEVKAKNSFTGAAQTVTKQDLLAAGSKNVLQSLAPFIPGMNISVNLEKGSDPNNKPDIFIRGRSSFRGASSMPTFIVDGAEVDADYVFDMDINEIVSVTILKDASASALYGAKAANGVVVITTKPLREGNIQISYNGTFRLSFPDLRDYQLLNSKEKLEYERLASIYTSESGPGLRQYDLDVLYNQKFQEVRRGVDIDWMSFPLRNSLAQTHNLFLNGGSNNIRYGLGIRYGDEQGVMKGSTRKRYGLNFKLSYNLGQKLTLINTTTITNINDIASPYGSFSEYVRMNPYNNPYNRGELLKFLPFDEIANPLYEASLGNYDNHENLQITNIFDVRWFLSEELRLEGSFSLDKKKVVSEKFTSPNSFIYKDNPVNTKGNITIGNSSGFDYAGKLFLSYNKMFTQGTLFTALAGSNFGEESIDANRFSGIGIFSDKLAHIGFTTSYPGTESPFGENLISRDVGFFTNLNYIYKNRYFSDFSFRSEGSSKFGKDQRFAPFWSMGVGWNIHKEAFFKSSENDVLKLRGSIGYLGNNNFDPYQAITMYKYSSDLFYSDGVGAIPITIGNPDLKWERTLNVNGGIELILFNSRWDLTLDIYQKITDNLLLDITKAPSLGIDQAKQNIGKIQNRGIELHTRVVPISTPTTMWSIALTASSNTNKILKISNLLKLENEKLNKKKKDGDKPGAKKDVAPTPLFEEGESISAIKVVQSGGIDPATGKEIFIKKDGNRTFIYDYNDKKIFGDTEPKLYGSISSFLNIKNFTLSAIFSYRLGATIYNQTLATKVEGSDPLYNVDKRVFYDRWKNVGDQVRYRGISIKDIPEHTSRFIEKEYRVDMTSLSVGYEVPQEKLQKFHLKALRIELMTNDIFNWSTIKQERGFDYPYARSFEISIRTMF